MPSVYLSPSTQDFNMFYDNSGSEEYYMNLIADYIEPYLTASGVIFGRNQTNFTVNESVADSNSRDYDLHVAIHSNAAGLGNAGRQTGSDTYYYATSVPGKRAADIIVKNMKQIYPDPDKVRALPNSTFAELRRVHAPSVLVEVAYHDSATDVEWIKNNLEPIARVLALSITEFLDVPFVDIEEQQTVAIPEESPTPPTVSTRGIVSTQGTQLNIRNQPSMNAEIIGKIPNGAAVTLTYQSGNWYGVNYEGIDGYSYAQYIRLE